MHLINSAANRPAREHTEVRDFPRIFAKIARRKQSGSTQVQFLSSDSDAGEAAAVVVDVLDGSGERRVIAKEHDKRDGPAVAGRRGDRLNGFAAAAIDQKMRDAQSLAIGRVFEVA